MTYCWGLLDPIGLEAFDLKYRLVWDRVQVRFAANGLGEAYWDAIVLSPPDAVQDRATSSDRRQETAEGDTADRDVGK